ncbi:hypothetical protein PR048_002281, partial [Dryococelus australis]
MSKLFIRKLLLFEQNSQKTFAHLVCCQQVFNLDAHFKAIRIFQNPLSCEIEDFQPSLQLELMICKLAILQLPSIRKLPKDNNFARSFLSIFGTTFRCEQTFSLWKFTKSKYR